LTTTVPNGRTPAQTKRLARLAGALYVSLGVATLFGFYHAPLVLADASAIARAISVPDFRFRIGVMSDVLSTALSIPLVVVLYQLFNPVHRMLAALMALWFIMTMPISFLGALDCISARTLLSGVPELSGLTEAQGKALGMFFLHRHSQLVFMEEIFWGLWLLPFGLLVMRSGFIPRVIGILLLVAGAAYITHSVASVLGMQRSVTFERLIMMGRAGELPIMLWLLIVGADTRRLGSEPN
jgi:hypothetical protein